MMPKNLSIKKVPDELVALLRERARRRHRSLQGELLAILEESLLPQRLTVAELAGRIRELGLRTPPEAAEMVREDRDGR